MIGRRVAQAIAAVSLVAGRWTPQELGAKTMFYNPFGVDARGTVATPINRVPALKPINWLPTAGVRPRHCGIHYWFESEARQPVTQNAAGRMGGRFTLRIRSSCNGFLTVWDVNADGRELTPRDTGPDWSGMRMSDQIYVVPGTFEFGPTGSADHLVIVCALSQTEIPHSAQEARDRVRHMLAWTHQGRKQIVTETDESTKGEIGSYVVNILDAGVVAEIVFRK